MAVAMVCAVSVSTQALAQETGSSGTTASSGDGLRAPGGLYDATPHTRKNQVSIWGDISWGSGIGVGARYTLPLLADGFLADFNDSVELEAGGDFYFFGWGGVSSLDIPVEARWTFHILPNLDLYGKVSVGLEMFFYSSGISLWPLFNVGPGIVYRLTDSMVLRAEVGYRGFRGGIGFDF